MSGQLEPRDVLPVAKSYARRRAIDVLRAQARKPGIERVDGDEVAPGVKSDLTDMIVSVLVDPGNRLHAVMTRTLGAIIEAKARPSDKKIWNALLDGARKGLSASDVARELGISKAAVSQAKKRVGVVIRDAIARNPKLIEPLVRQHELEQLGLARRAGRVGQQSNTSPVVERSRRRSSAMAWRRLTFGRSRPMSASSRTSVELTCPEGTDLPGRRACAGRS
jgi:hypothetical protein